MGAVRTRVISMVTAASASLIAVFSAGAQSARIVGVVYDSAAHVPLAGAVVSLLDASGVTSARTTADAAGRFTLSRPQFSAQLRAIRIGYRPISVALPMSSRDTTIELVLTRVPPVLGTVRVADRRLCPGSDDHGEAFQLWEQVRAGLLATIVARDMNVVTATTVVFRRQLSPNDDAVRGERQDVFQGQTTKPFTSAANAATLARSGFMTEDSTGRMFFGPDEDVLLDETFAATHCFHLEPGQGAHAGEVGVGFDPAPGRDTLVDVNGVIWLDATPLALRSLDFSFVGLEPAASRARAGGHLEFQSMADGVARATSWSLRVPVLTSAVGATSTLLQPRQSRARRDRTDIRLSEVHEINGEILEMSWRDGAVFHSDPTGIFGTVSRDGDRVVPHALITRQGSATTTVADGSGQFVLTPLLPGRYEVTIQDTSLASFVEPRRVAMTVDVRRGQLTPLQIEFPPIAKTLAAACGRPTDSAAANVFGRIVLPPLDGDKPRLRASWEARSDSAVSDRYADVDDHGSFRLCGVARNTATTLHLRIGTREADTTITVDDRVANSFQWRPALVAAVARAVPRSIRGVVVDSANRPMQGVNVTARGHGVVSTDATGRFRFQTPSSEPVVFDARRLGFTPTRYALDRGDDTSIVITMLPAVQELATVDITASGTGSARLLGFEERLREQRHATTSAVFITAADIDRRHADRTTSLFREIPGMRVIRIGMTTWQVFGISRGGKGGAPCAATVFLDGHRIPDANIDGVIDPGDIAGIEVYPSANAAPAQYQSLNGGCAVVLLWRKTG